MCIIAAKPSGVSMPDRNTIKTMWNVNHDGAGLMWVEKGQVRIEKGFMKYKSFATKLDELENRLDLTATPVVMHFRITTHGGTKPENTHPFPVTDSIGALKKLVSVTDVGVAHNGIIPINPRKGISDTMEYVATQLAPLKRALPRFYENKHAMQLIQNAIASKMAFLTRDGKIYTIGNFINEDGMLYSNSSYAKMYTPYRNSYYSCYADDDWNSTWGYAKPSKPSKKSDTAKEITDYNASFGITGDPYEDEDETAWLMWLRESDMVRGPDGQLFEGLDYLIDEDSNVYYYDAGSDMAVTFPGASAITTEGMPVKFCDDKAEIIYVSPF